MSAGAAKALISGRQPLSEEVVKELTMSSCKPEDDNLLSMVQTWNGILFQAKVELAPTVSPELALQEGPKA